MHLKIRKMSYKEDKQIFEKNLIIRDKLSIILEFTGYNQQIKDHLKHDFKIVVIIEVNKLMNK